MDWPYTSEEWFWTIMFAVIVIGAAGGWAYLIARIAEHVRYRRADPSPGRPTEADPLGDVQAEIRRIHEQEPPAIVDPAWLDRLRTIKSIEEIETIKERHGG